MRISVVRWLLMTQLGDISILACFQVISDQSRHLFPDWWNSSYLSITGVWKQYFSMVGGREGGGGGIWTTELTYSTCNVVSLPHSGEHNRALFTDVNLPLLCHNMISSYLGVPRYGKGTAKLFPTSRGRNILCLGAEDMRVKENK